MNRKEELLKELQDLEKLETEQVEEKINPEDQSNEPIQAQKKPRTKKQQEAFEKARLKMLENTNKRLMEKKQKEEDEKKQMEEKVVKKAIAIKKKQLKKEQIIDELSGTDDDEPIEKIKNKLKKEVVQNHPPPEAPRVVYRFF